MFHGGQCLFRQHGALVHTSNRAQGLPKDNVPDLLTKEEWHPLLNPVEFCVLVYYGKQYLHRCLLNDRSAKILIGTKMGQITDGFGASHSEGDSKEIEGCGSA